VSRCAASLDLSRGLLGKTHRSSAASGTTLQPCSARRARWADAHASPGLVRDVLPVCALSVCALPNLTDRPFDSYSSWSVGVDCVQQPAGCRHWTTQVAVLQALQSATCPHSFLSCVTASLSLDPTLQRPGAWTAPGTQSLMRHKALQPQSHRSVLSESVRVILHAARKKSSAPQRTAAAAAREGTRAVRPTADRPSQVGRLSHCRPCRQDEGKLPQPQ
jgi:hypothetical protein